VERGQRGSTRQGEVNQSRLSDTKAQEKRRTEKRRNGYRGGEEMTALGGGKEGRKERTKSLPLPPDRTAQRRWIGLIEEVEKKNPKKEKKKSSLRREKRKHGRFLILNSHVEVCNSYTC
jgi:hypothetical protein